MVKRILILGDSLAKGIGARKKENTPQGRLKKDFPNAEIENLAVSGARTKDVLKQIKKAKNKKYDLIVLNVGMNDIFHLTNPKEVKNDLSELLNQVKAMGKRVIMSTGENITLVPKIIWPLNKIFFIRQRRLSRLFRRLAKKSGINYLDLFKETKNDKLIMKNPEKYFSKDNLHPSDEGYGLWYSFLKKYF